jgi:hypothetical protein
MLVEPDLKPRAQGDIGEAAAMAWFARVGIAVMVPLFHSPDYDLVVDLGGSLNRVQVKTSRHKKGDRFAVGLCTHGGNQSWNGLVRRFDPSRYDLLFALIGDGRRWLIPSHAIEGTTVIVLGGPKYAEFEIDPTGAPAYAFHPPLESDAHSGGAPESGEPGWTVNPVPR